MLQFHIFNCLLGISHWNFKLNMPKSEIGNFPSKLNCSLFTISIQGAPYFVATLTPSFPKVLSRINSRGSHFCICTDLSASLPAFPQGHYSDPGPHSLPLWPHPSNIIPNIIHSTYVFWKSNVHHLLGSRTTARTKWDSSLVQMGLYLTTGKEKINKYGEWGKA